MATGQLFSNDCVAIVIHPAKSFVSCPAATVLQFESMIKGAGVGLSCMLYDPRGTMAMAHALR
jgi:hypothetical protein